MARSRVRSVRALLRCAGWAVLLHAVDRPWRELGGLLDERQRWLERCVLGTALVVGWTIGLRPPELGATRWLAPAAGVALAMLLLALRGSESWILLLLVGWLAYCAGLDLAERAWPFLRAAEAAETDAEEEV